uniref:Protein kinase domain-containing protein n=1 Tax=Tetradesmus obliquus TaxID=3088 RepID=A0A383VPQ0_TETOB
MPTLLDLCCCCGASFSGEELYKEWDKHPAVQQYSFVKRLGEGGFSEVQLAQDKLTGKAVALKIIFLNRPGLTAEQRKILAGEAKLIRMVAHPHIVRCMQVLETRRQQVVDAMAYLHSLGIMHRDIKPENCLLAKPAQHYAAKVKPVKVKVIDLGMAGLFRPARPLYGCMGSPGFIAPEVVLGDAHTPAMDVYSLGVLLFVMLVGRKPWDSQRSHTLQYAVYSSAEAPGLADPSFLALSGTVRQLLLQMLAELPEARPSAAAVLAHPWMRQGAQGAAPERLIQPAVQHRLRMLGNSRQVMGTAHGMLLLHSTGSRSSAVAFHKAVKEAKHKLQQQAAALNASGQLQQLHQQEGPAASGAAASAHAGSAAGGSSNAAVSADSAHVAAAGAAASAAPQASAAAGAAEVAGSHAEADGVSSAAAAATAASGGARPLGRKSATVGQLARASLTQQSMLFDGKRPSAAASSAATAARPAPAAAAARSSERGSHNSNAAAAAAAVQRGTAAGACAAAGCTGSARPVSPDPAVAVMLEALERGMSVPNPEVGLLLSDGYNTQYMAHRADRAVSMSPGALALLDADDRLCLLAAGTSADEDSAGWGPFSWGGRRGAADMAASFKQRYPARPIMRSIVQLGQSLSSSLGRSLRHSAAGLGLSSSLRSPGRHTFAAAADLSMHAHTVGFERCPSARRSQTDDGSSAASPGVQHLLSRASTANRCLSGALHDVPELIEGDSGAAAGAAAELAGIAEGSGTHGRDSSTVGAPGDMVLQGPPVGQVAAAAAEGTAVAGVSDGGTSKPAVPGNNRAGLSRRFASAAEQAAAEQRARAAAQQRGIAADGGVGVPVIAQGAGSSEEGHSLLSDAGSSQQTATPSMDGEYLAFLGTALSMSPPLSPEGAVPAGLAENLAAGAAAAAAAAGASRVQQQHQQQQQQQADGGSAEPAAVAAATLLQRRQQRGQQNASQPAGSKREQQQLPNATALAVAIGQPAAHKRSSNATPFGNPSAAAAAAAAAQEHRVQQPQRQQLPAAPQLQPPAARGSVGARSVMTSPSMRAAATAAAARDEEEGLGLPNGLWLPLQQALSVDTTPGAASALIPALSASSSALQSPQQSGPGGIGSLTDVQFMLQQDGEAARDSTAGTTIRAASDAAGEVPAGRQAAAAADAENGRERSDSAAAAGGLLRASRHKRDVSMFDWLEDGPLQPGSGLSMTDWLRPDLPALGLAGDVNAAGADAGEGQPAADPAAAGTAARARRSSCLGSVSSSVEAARPHFIPVRPGAHHHVAVPHLGRQHSSSRGLRRSLLSQQRQHRGSHGSRRLRSISCSGGDPASTAGLGADGDAAVADGAAPGATLDADALAADGQMDSCSMPAVDEAASAAGRGSLELLSGDFYVGSYLDGRGLEQQLGLTGGRLGSAGEEALEDEDDAGGDGALQQRRRSAGPQPNDAAQPRQSGDDDGGGDGVLMLLDEQDGGDAAASMARLSSASDGDWQQQLVRPEGAAAGPHLGEHGTRAGPGATAGKGLHETASSRRAVGGQALVPLVYQSQPAAGAAAAAAAAGSRPKRAAAPHSAGGHGWQSSAAAKAAAARAAAAFDDFDEPTAYFYAS